MSGGWPPWVQLLRGFFALLLLGTAIGKLLDMPGFIGVVNSYRVLPDALLAPSALALTATELVLGLWLILATRVPVRFVRRLDLAGAAVVALHVMYMAWLIPAYLRGLELPNCGCFGVYFPRPLTGQTLVEDGILLVAAFVLWLGVRVRIRGA